MTKALAIRDRAIAHLEKANAELTLAKEQQDVRRAKGVYDVAQLTLRWSRDHDLSDEIINRGHALKIAALSVIGELLNELPRQAGSRGRVIGPGRGKIGEPGVLKEIPVSEAPPTLAELGLTKKVSAVAQQLAALPSETREAIAQRETTLAQARRKVKAETIRKQVPLPTAKYRVVYADPPWAYNDKADEGAVQSGGAEKHYPSLSITELCQLPVPTFIENDAVIFLWVTSPLIFEAAAVIEAWGFTYKAMFVWDKVKHNMGHYTSVRHELLLICTPWELYPDVVQLFDSVQSIERTTHSTKPEQFRTIIDTLYPHGKRVELFARGAAPAGWETWGYEAVEAVTS